MKVYRYLSPKKIYFFNPFFVIAQLKADSDAKFEDMKVRFKGFKETIEAFAKNELRPLIKQNIEAEKKKRRDNDVAQAGLKIECIYILSIGLPITNA